MGDQLMRFGIVGTGAMAHTMMRAFAVMTNVQVAAVASRSEERAAQFARDYRIPHHFGAIESLAECSNVDIVYVASHPMHHVDDVLMALEAGKPVLCEKPLATTVSGSEKLAEAASRRGVFLMEGMWIRFLPAVRRAAQLAHDRVAGVPRLLQADFGYPVAASAQGIDVGVLLDQAVYPISLAILLLGTPHDATAFLVRGNDGVPSQASFLLRHDGGALSQLSVSTEAFLGNRALIACDHGRIELAEPLLGAELVKVSMHAPIKRAHHPNGPLSGKARAVEALKSSTLLRRLRATYLKRDHTGFASYGSNPYVPQLAETVRCVSQGALQSPLMPVEHSVEALRVIERVQERS
jgi:predicted dehydrogenase